MVWRKWVECDPFLTRGRTIRLARLDRTTCAGSIDAMLRGMPEPRLDELGVRPGERVRWRRRDGGHWAQGSVTGRERDGSVAVRDSQGRARAFVVERLEIRATGPRGASGWEPLIDRVKRIEQLRLFG